MGDYEDCSAASEMEGPADEHVTEPVVPPGARPILENTDGLLDPGMLQKLGRLDSEMGDACHGRRHHNTLHVMFDVLFADSLPENDAKERGQPSGLVDAVRMAREIEAELNLEKSVFSALEVADLKQPKQEGAETPVATA